MTDQKVAPFDGGAAVGNEARDAVAVWPCANCGRPVPQPVRGARTVRYCPDGDGKCAAEAKERRERGRESPGLTGQVAWAWEIVERLESAADQLAGSLASELSVAGVERRVAAAHAESAGQIAAAQEERDASQRQAQSAWQEATLARARADHAEAAVTTARSEAEKAIADRDTATRECQEAREALEQATAARLAAESERDHVVEREGELLAALEAARAELVTLHSRLSETETTVQGQRIEAAAARRAAEDLRSGLRDAETKRGQAVADRDQIQARLQDVEQHNWHLSQAVEELRATVQALTGERDAARAEAERARRHIDTLTQITGRGADQYNGMRPQVEPEPPTGIHSLHELRLPHAG
ncbi:coiled-coil domain-containing protein [Actinomadura rudentiformis]|uniref:Chromosome segregation ATPase n=1 Tax=Actinomadura rudentiformis TaxID=359158 RepID=A0A6H9YEH9_9ACTN|nr:hypothetical protein [Actinomadura rudentiformis]KAB2344304.1 hypothetical protein F8566_30605 [Actinomadura rudentiformis]